MRGMPAVPTLPASVTLNAAVLKKAIDRYYRELDAYKGRAQHELALRSAFQNLLANTARYVNWTLIPEQTLEGGIRPDGVIRDSFNLKRGFWEAKGPQSDLDKEIIKKIDSGYPLTNTLFENTRQAILFQNKRRTFEFNLHNPKEVSDLLSQFFTYTEPNIATFEAAVQEFKDRVPELAQALLRIIEREFRQNNKFIAAFDTFAELCRASLDPGITANVINEMLVQHLLTERLFSKVFDNSDFIRRNAIATEIEKVINALTSRSFNRHDFLKSLDRFYVAIEAASRSNNGWQEQQHFLNTVYERFFQGYSVKRADTYGIVYTPQEIVDFMCASVDEVLRREFNISIEEPGVQIIDPCVGTGSFILNLIRNLIPRARLKHKYKHDLFCNEIMLLPYYIASLNIEHEYYEKMGEYAPFEGICFADTLELTNGAQLSMFGEENTERVQREKDAQVRVVIGNPPYNVGQKSENDNNKNRRYPVIDKRISETYVKASKATNKNKLYDAYIKFFRWATDRLGERDGIVCLVSNNSFFEDLAFDGFRKRVVEEFSHVYLLDLGGDARGNGGGNVFGITVGVGITLLIRRRTGMNTPHHLATIHYYKVPENQNSHAKLNFLTSQTSIKGIEWQELHLDENYNWLNEKLRPEFNSFLSIGTKEAKSARIVEVGGMEVKTIFKAYSPGVQTNRDSWMYDFDGSKLALKASNMIETYNAELSRWIRGGSPKEIDNFVLADETKIKWCSRLKECLVRKREAKFHTPAMRNAMYRPFTRKFLYFDSIMTHRRGAFPNILPLSVTEFENTIIVVSDRGYRAPFSTFVTNFIPDLHVLASTDGFQCFPYYTYAEDGSNRRENITDWVLAQFQAKYGSDVTKWDIFYYVYAMLHHVQYREHYAENLKHDLPHIPLLRNPEEFQTCVCIGKQLMELHLHYEQVKEYPLQWIENQDVPFSYRVEKMRLTANRSAVVVNQSLTLAGVPPQAFAYRLGNRSALDWVINQYQVGEDKRSGIASDPNSLNDEEYIVRLVGRVVTVSVETVQLVDELAGTVTMDDWNTSDQPSWQ